MGICLAAGILEVINEVIYLTMCLCFSAASQSSGAVFISHFSDLCFLSHFSDHHSKLKLLFVEGNKGETRHMSLILSQLSGFLAPTAPTGREGIY